MPKLLIIDVSSVIYRAFYSSPKEVYFYPRAGKIPASDTGLNIGAILTIQQMTCRFLKKHKPTHLVACFDTHGGNWRHDIFPSYKANRKVNEYTKADRALIAKQTALTKSMFGYMNFPCDELSGYEADDLIGTYAALADDRCYEVIIMGQDKDLLQLVSPSVKMDDGQCLWDEREAHKRFGVMPEYIADFLALKGDAADGIPGLLGCGKRRATSLIGQFGGIEQIIERSNEIAQDNLRETVKNFAEELRLYKRLTDIPRDVPVSHDIDSLAIVRPDDDIIEEIGKRFGGKDVAALMREAFDSLDLAGDDGFALLDVLDD